MLERRFEGLGLDFRTCRESWDDYEAHSAENARVRAEAVRSRIRDLVVGERYRHVVIVTHRGFAAWLVKGEKFETCGE